MHYALRRLADELLPLYEPDDGELTEQQRSAIRQIAVVPPTGEICSSLFEN